MVGSVHRSMKATGVALIALSLLLACAPAVDESLLPAVPAVKISGYQLTVREQLKTARERFERKPLSAKLNGQLGMMYRTYRDFAAAEALFARARMLDPRSPDWAYYHGEVLEQQARYPEALEAVEAFVKHEPNDLAGLIRRGRLHALLGNIDAALSQLAPLYEQSPQIGDIGVAYAQALAQSGRTDEAIEVWQATIENVGRFKVAHYALAQLLRRRGDNAAAEQQLWLFNTVAVEDPPAYDPRLSDLFKLNLSDRAYVIAAQRAKRDGDPKQALALLEKALERSPDNLQTRASLVMGYAAESDFTAAQRHIEEGLALDSQHVELGLAIARVRLQQGKLTEARTRLIELAERSPKHALIRAWLGRVYEVGGALSDADAAYEQAFAADPQNLVARRFYSRWVVAQRDPASAAQALEAIVRAPARDEPVILGTLAQVLVRLGRTEDAVNALSRGIDRARWQKQSQLVARLENQRASVQWLAQ